MLIARIGAFGQGKRIEVVTMKDKEVLFSSTLTPEAALILAEELTRCARLAITNSKY